MTVCYFGSYEPQYPRNVITMKGFKALGWDIIECNDRTGGIKHYLGLINQFVKGCRKSNLIFIGVLGHYDVPLAWIMAKAFKKKIIFDAFYSVYDTYVEDRKAYKKWSLNALRFYFYDWISVRLADKVILDTNEQIEYFIKEFHLSGKKFFELPVCADDQIFKKGSIKKHTVPTIGFYGSFLPLHGVSVIVEVMNILRKDSFRCYLLGSGPGLKVIKKEVTNRRLKGKIKFYKNLPYSDLPKFFTMIDLFLAGPFGNTNKAQRILLAKTVEALSFGIPTVITKTPACKRLIGKYKNNVIWVENNKPDTLTKIIKDFFKTFDQKNAQFKQSKDDFPLSFLNFTKKMNEIITY